MTPDEAHLRRVIGSVPLPAALAEVVRYAELWAAGMRCARKRVAAEVALERVRAWLKEGNP